MNAGYSNTVSGNVFVGAYVGYYNTTGIANVGLGGASVGVTNTTLQANTTGSYNTAIGSAALQANTTASNNTAVGYQAGYSNTTATRVTAIGMRAGYSGTTGSNYSTYVGYKAGYSATGQGNVCIGDSTGESLTTGTANTFIGANNGVNGAAGQSMTTGSNNTIIGAYNGNQGGLDIRTVNNYIVLSDGDGNPRGFWSGNGTFATLCASGGDAFYPSTVNAAGTSRWLILGSYGATSAGALGTNSFGVFTNGNVVNTNNSYGTLSDVKLKENIVNASPKLDDVMRLQVRNFNLKADQSHKQIGFIAQEFEEVFPAMVDATPDRDEEGNETGDITKSIKTSVLIPILVKAIQEQQAIIESLKARLDAANL
jgi:hypothetical protein